MKPHFIIVGGGSAGAVLAARLSADAKCQVLLLEAGPNFTPDGYPSVLTDANIVAGSPTFDWRYHTEDAPRLGHNIPVARGRVIGGSSAVNAAVTIRARAADFSRWVERGIEGWSWKEVLAAYKALENTPTGDDAWHGRSGPFPIRQRTAQENTPSMRAFVEASAALGLTRISDFNGTTQHGVGPYPLNVVDGVRINTGMAYLTSTVRARANLAIGGDTEVDSVVMEGKRAVGVKLVEGEVLLAGEVVLAAGVFGSPAILLRSGIGPSQHLSELGIVTIANLPLGKRLQDHPFFYNVYALKREANAMKPVAGGVTFARLLEKAGLPNGLFHVLPGGPETGAALVKEPLINMISFTGSTRVGRQVGSVASEQLKRVSLELGGNNPYIVLDDADIEAAASAGAWGAFFHQGQICLTGGRHLVHERVADPYVEALVRNAKALVVGDPSAENVQVGPIINERQAANVERIVAETIAKGAQIITGGSRKGLFFEPTVIPGVTPGMAAFDEERFGPIAVITTFGNDEEAIALANATDYGLVAAVVSADLVRAQRIADGLHSGVIHINDQTVLHGVYGPIGGVGASGNGFGHGTVSNADQFGEWQWITTRSQIPAYPF